MKSIKLPKFKRIDLSKCCKAPGGCGESDHPDINSKKEYLARIEGVWHTGFFSRQWFGWSFNLGSHSNQLDKPGTNHSRWEALFEICD